MATDDIFGPSQPEGGIGHEIATLFRSIKNILIKRFRINLLVLVVLLSVAVAGTILLKKPAVTGAVVGLECPEQNLSCPECPSCLNISTPTCEELNCTKDVVKEVEVNKFFYVCEESGAIVNKSEDCKPVFPVITSNYVETANDITFSIDDWVVSFENKTSGRIKTVDYTIINRGDKKIEPRVKIYFYSGSWADADLDTNFGFYSDKILGKDEWIRESKKLNLFFSMEDPKVRFELINALTNDPLLAVVRQIDTE